jgi:nitrate reductase gamma subunit
MIFHLAMIITPTFLGPHILLWQRSLGFSWPALPQPVADFLTLAGIATGVVLIVRRISARASRDLSRFQDYVLPVLITIIFTTGYLAMHPGSDPLPYETVMLIHIVCGNLLLVALPFSKLSHAFLFPLTRLVSDMGWHLAPDAGHRVAAALNKEDQPI